MTKLHTRLHKIARKIAKHRFKTLPYTTPEDVYQAAYIGALLASRKPEFRPDDPGGDWWLHTYALQQVASQEQPMNKASSRCPKTKVDRFNGGRGTQSWLTERTYTVKPTPYSPTIRTRIMDRARDGIDRRIMEMKLDTDMTTAEIGAVVGLDQDAVYKRFKRIRLWARQQDFMLTTYQDLTGKPYETQRRSNRNPNQGHHPSGHSEPERDEPSEADRARGGD